MHEMNDYPTMQQEPNIKKKVVLGRLAFNFPEFIGTFQYSKIFLLMKYVHYKGSVYNSGVLNGRWGQQPPLKLPATCANLKNGLQLCISNQYGAALIAFSREMPRLTENVKDNALKAKVFNV